MFLGSPLVPQSFAETDIVGDVRTQLAQNSFSSAASELSSYKAQHGVTPEYLEALSWMARGAAGAKQWEQATTYATETRTLSERQLTKRKLDADTELAESYINARRTKAELDEIEEILGHDKAERRR